MTFIHQKNSTKINPIHAISKIATNESERYKFLSSDNIKGFFESQGFTLDGASYANCRKPEKVGFQKHLMLFSRPDLLIDGGNRLQLLVQNSHDGSSSLKLNLGVYRAICANGLISGNDIYQQTVRHVGKHIIEQVEDSLYYILGHMDNLKTEVRAMQNRILSFEESQQYMKNAVDMRLKDIDVHSVRLDTVDRIRRQGDQGQDLYTVFNRVQESVIRGGIQYKKNVDTKLITGELEHSLKNATTRGITSIPKTIELNKNLWSSAMELVA